MTGVRKTRDNGKTRGFYLLSSIFYILLLSGGCWNGSISGSGDDGAITISSANELARIGLESAYPLNGVYVLAANIELTDWTPVGTDSGSPFTGTFDGNNKTITLKSFGSGVSHQYFGIFGYTDGAVLKNSGIAGTVTVAWDKPDNKALFFGGLAGYVKNTEITRCVSRAAINAVSVQGPVYAGGLAGYTWGSTITDCTASGTVTADGKGHNSSAGGIAGYNRTSRVDGCSASGNIRLSAIDPESRKDATYLYMIYAGGLLGYTGDSSVVSGSYATGDVYATSPYPYAGGLVGYNYGTLTGTGVGSVINTSYAAGNATAEAVVNALPYAGGLVGYNSGDKTTIENCYAAGTVLAKSGGGLGWAGGISGANANSALISKCYAVSRVTVEVGSGPLPFSQPDVSEGACAGGIVGYNYFTPTTRVEYCAALNESVSGTAGNSIYALHRVAGRSGGVSTPVLENNIAAAGMAITPEPSGWDKTRNGVDGADCDANPDQSVFTASGWDFGGIWKMGAEYPVLKWEE